MRFLKGTGFGVMNGQMRAKICTVTGSQAFSGELIDHVQDPEGHSIVGPGMHEIIAPDMLRMRTAMITHRAECLNDFTEFCSF